LKLFDQIVDKFCTNKSRHKRYYHESSRNQFSEEVALSASMQIIPASIRMYNDSSIIEAIVCFALYNYYYYYCYHRKIKYHLCHCVQTLYLNFRTIEHFFIWKALANV